MNNKIEKVEYFTSSKDIHSINAKNWYGLTCSVEQVALLFPTFREIAKKRYFSELYQIKDTNND